MSECVMLTQIKDLEHQLDAAQSQCIISENKVNKIKESITLLRQKVSNSKATKLMVFSLLNRHHSSWGWFSTYHWITFSFKTYELNKFFSSRFNTEQVVFQVWAHKSYNSTSIKIAHTYINEEVLRETTFFLL